jgi:DNA-directed RNA polymerase subunit M
MLFCPKCGSLLKTKKQGTKTVQFCSCGYSSAAKKATFSEKVEHEDDTIQVRASTDDILPVAENLECPKCKHDKAYFWMKQTRAGDEPETKFFKCTECKHTWRDYS